MNTINVNGQNSAAASAMIKDAVVKAVKQINKAENAKMGFVKFGDDMRLSFDGARFIKEGKDNFIFNGKIAKKGGNGRYDQVLVVIHYKNLDNKEGLCLDDMVNAVLVAILNDIDSAIVKYEAADSDYSFYTQTLQNFRNEFFGSILVVDNSEVYEAPVLDETPILEECDGDDITIRKFYDSHKNDNGDVESPINYYIDKFMSPDDVEVFKNLVEKTDDDGIFFMGEDADGDLSVAGNESFCLTYFDDDVPMVQMYGSLMDSMKKEIAKIENEIEKEIDDSKYKVLDAFECGGDFNVEYDEWWDYVLGKTPDWIIDKYFDKFCDVLYGYFVKFAKDYGYDVQKLDDGISLKKSDNNN